MKQLILSKIQQQMAGTLKVSASSSVGMPIKASINAGIAHCGKVTKDYGNNYVCVE